MQIQLLVAFTSGSFPPVGSCHAQGETDRKARKAMDMNQRFRCLKGCQRPDPDRLGRRISRNASILSMLGFGCDSVAVGSVFGVGLQNMFL